MTSLTSRAEFMELVSEALCGLDGLLDGPHTPSLAELGLSETAIERMKTIVNDMRNEAISDLPLERRKMGAELSTELAYCWPFPLELELSGALGRLSDVYRVVK